MFWGNLSSKTDEEKITVAKAVLEHHFDVQAGFEASLDIEEPSHKRSVLFGGTLLVNHTPFATEDATGSATGIDSIPPPPDGGLVTLVLRTGFDTVQGSLLRTMVHSTVSSSGQSDGINTTDTYIFVALLLLCAVASSVLVLQEGWSDPLGIVSSLFCTLLSLLPVSFRPNCQWSFL